MNIPTRATASSASIIDYVIPNKPYKHTCQWLEQQYPIMTPSSRDVGLKTPPSLNMVIITHYASCTSARQSSCDWGGGLESDPSRVADRFNGFLATVGRKARCRRGTTRPSVQAQPGILADVGLSCWAWCCWRNSNSSLQKSSYINRMSTWLIQVHQALIKPVDRCDERLLQRTHLNYTITQTNGQDC